MQDLSYLLSNLDSDPRTTKYRKLNKALVELVEGFSLVGFQTLAVEVSRSLLMSVAPTTSGSPILQDKESMLNIVRLVDKMTGYIFIPSGDLEGTNAINTQALFGSAMSSAKLIGRAGGDVRDVQERWMDNKEAWDEWEKEEWKKEAEIRAQLGAGISEGTKDGESPESTGI